MVSPFSSVVTLTPGGIAGMGVPLCSVCVGTKGQSVKRKTKGAKSCERRERQQSNNITRESLSAPAQPREAICWKAGTVCEKRRKSHSHLRNRHENLSSPWLEVPPRSC